MNNTVNTASLTDQERMEDLIAQEKYLINGYATFIPEAGCPNLRQVLTENLNACLNNQYSVYDTMSQLGWYPVKNAPQNEIDEAVTKCSQLHSQLG